MTNLVHRTEEALLGALIYDPSLAADVPYLTPSHFDNPEHQIIFGAFVDIHTNDPALFGAALSARIVEQAELPGLDEQRLAGLALNSPDMSSAATYGRMIQEAALRRELAVHAERLAAAAGSVRGVDPELDHLALLSDALRTHSLGFTIEVDLTITAATRDDLRALREEQLLSDLIQHPENIPEVAAWLDEDVFTNTVRRDIYRAIVNVELYGEPVEELTLAWELSRSRSAELSLSRDVDLRPADSPTAPGYVARLAQTTVVAGASIEIGRDLLADHTRTELAESAAKVSVVADHTTSLRNEVQQQRTVTRQQTTTPLLTPPDHRLGLDGPEMRQQ